MADPFTIAKAKASAIAMKGFFGVEPELDIQSNYVRVYYPPNTLIKAQKVFNDKMDGPPGNVRVDIKEVVNPYVIKKYGPYILGLFVFGIFIGNQIDS